jgi:hypothetical protein
VDLSLRRQWVVGVAPDQLHALANGAFSADAELIAIFDPYEVVALDQQLSDLQFAIGASQLATDVGGVLERIRAQVEPVDELPEEGNDPFATLTTTSSSSPSPFDPFAPSPVPLEANEDNTGRRGRRGRKSREESNPAPPENSSGGGFSDPFADPFA